MAAESYRELRAWKLAMKIAVDCYELTKGFPPEEAHGISADIRIASSRTAARIAEGSARGRIDNIQLLRVAQAHLNELQTNLILSCMVGLAEDEPVNAIMDECENEAKLIGALIRSLEASE